MQPTTQLPGQQPRNKRPVPLILGVLLAVVLLCCGGAGVLGKLVSDAKSTSQSPAGLSAPIVYPSSPTPSAAVPSSAAPSSAVPTTTAPPVPAPTTKATTEPTTKRPTAKVTTKVPATKAPTAKPKPKPTTVPPPVVVHPGAFCAPAGATGVTTKGTLMVCGRASDGRNRWKRA